MCLVLRQFWSQRRDDDPEPKETLYLPLYFDGNSSSIHIGDRNRDISELGLGLPPQPTDFEGVETENSSGQEFDSGSDSDTDSDSEWEPETAIPVTAE